MKIILLSILIFTSLGQQCLNSEGKRVDWWAILKVPPKIGSSGYGYLDSTLSSDFQYLNTHVDDGKTSLTMTLLQINSLKLENIAWNDQKPTGQTSTKSAHSKGLVAFSFDKKRGFLLSHSIPKYPAYSGDQILLTIAPAQNYYGQNLFCLSLSINQLDKLASNLITTHLYVYYSNVKDGSATHNLYQMGKGQQTTPSTNFQYQQLNPTSAVKVKAIFKNGGQKNCSIFEDGLTNYLKESLVAETWGRPLQKSWCHSPYSVTNVQSLGVGSLKWTQQDDHSKWVVSNSYACFGDMNRMDSQWKRGGSFFCLQNSNVAKALKKVIFSSQTCEQNQLKYE